VGCGHLWMRVDAARKERVREEALLLPTRESVGALSPLSRHLSPPRTSLSSSALARPLQKMPTPQDVSTPPLPPRLAMALQRILLCAGMLDMV